MNETIQYVYGVLVTDSVRGTSKLYLNRAYVSEGVAKRVATTCRNRDAYWANRRGATGSVDTYTVVKFVREEPS